MLAPLTGRKAIGLVDQEGQQSPSWLADVISAKASETMAPVVTQNQSLEEVNVRHCGEGVSKGTDEP
jgi:hypothetical protein